MATSASDTVIPDSTEPEPEIDDQKKYGFIRPEMNKEELAGTVHHYERHVFLSYKDHQSWPSIIETSENDQLPCSLASSLKARKSDIPQKTRLTICQAFESDGEVFIFPDMIKYKGLVVSDIEGFVEDVFVKEKDWSVATPEKLEGSYIFVCAHTNRDMRCGTCGPILIETIQKEISKQALEKSIFVKSCSHIGGHKYAGNVIIYSQDASGQISGHWYGYVTPDDVPALLDEHIGKGKIIEKLWRGQMGVAEPEQKVSHQKRLEAISQTVVEDQNNGCNAQPNGNSSKPFTCCQDNSNKTTTKETKAKSRQIWNCTFDSWERGDTVATIAVGVAIAAVVFAFSLSRKSSS